MNTVARSCWNSSVTGSHVPAFPFPLLGNVLMEHSGILLTYMSLPTKHNAWHRESTKKSRIEMILCTIPKWPICVSSALRFRGDPCVSYHQWFVVEAWPGYRSKCMTFEARAWFCSTIKQLSIITFGPHFSALLLHAKMMKLFLLNHLCVSLQ